jgi:site-specific DNA-methyltransferase (adenine-specific)
LLMRVEKIGDATLYQGDAWEILPQLEDVGAVITDPPYSERCHAGHDAGAAEARDGATRSTLGYSALSEDAAYELARAYAACCSGWIVWMTDSDLALVVRKALEQAGRYAFAPLPFYQPGRSVRLSGDGPSSWTDWIVVARTKAQMKWGTLPGGYVAGPGWNDKARMGGKPTALMEALVLDYSRAGDIVLDSHMGAGTTGVACMRTGRRFIGIEIDADAFDLSCRRIEQAYKQRPLFEAEPAKAPEQIGLEV